MSKSIRKKINFMFRKHILSIRLEKKPEFPLQRCDLLIMVLGLDSILYLIYNEVLNKDNDPQRSFWWILYCFFFMFFIWFLLHLFFCCSHKGKTQFCIYFWCISMLQYIFFLFPLHFFSFFVHKPQHLFYYIHV